MPTIVQRILPADLPNRRDRERRKPRYVVVHDTGNSDKGADALAHASYMENMGRRVQRRDPKATLVSWHYTVDDQRIVQHLPDNEPAYHAGDGGDGPGNMWGLGVEICQNEDGDRAKAEENAAWLVAVLLRRHGLGLDAVRQHYEFSPWKKNCPALLRPRWGEFLKKVQHYLGTEGAAVGQRTLRRGDRGDDVVRLQKMLMALGYKLPRYGADGAFGAETEQAVKAFQKAKGLVVDGIVGPKTWTALEAAYRAKTQPKPAPKPKPEPDELELVIAGAFTPGTGNAQAHLARLKQKGFDGWTIKVPRNWVDILKGAKAK